MISENLKYLLIGKIHMVKLSSMLHAVDNFYQSSPAGLVVLNIKQVCYATNYTIKDLMMVTE